MPESSAARTKKIPIILDTDIGSDIDDTWAIAMMLHCPELDVRMIVSAFEDTQYRAKLICRLLEIAGRTDIPVGIGTNPQKINHGGPQEKWVADYDLARYRGTLHADGVDAMRRMLMSAEETVTVIGIGPLSNIGELLRREPAIAPKTRFVGMLGSIYRGYREGPAKPIAEYNVIKDLAASQAVFAAPWKAMIITPLDTCARVQLDEAKYKKITSSAKPLPRAVIENYRVWLGGKPDTKSTILYDTAAVYLAYSEALMEMQDLKVKVNEQGFTVVDPAARTIRCALDWKDLGAFEDHLIERVLAG